MALTASTRAIELVQQQTAPMIDKLHAEQRRANDLEESTQAQFREATEQRWKVARAVAGHPATQRVLTALSGALIALLWMWLSSLGVGPMLSRLLEGTP